MSRILGQGGVDLRRRVGSDAKRRSTRRAFLIALAAGALAVSVGGEAQQPGRMYRVGFIGNSTAALEAHLVEPFRERLRELGYDERRNVVLEYRWAEGKYERFPAFVADLIARKVDVIVTAGTPATVAVKKATAQIPVVMVAVADPVGDGIVASLARPGANITGVSSIALDLEGKRLELLREVVSNAATIAVLWNPLNTSHASAVERVRAAAQVLQMKVQFVGVRASEDLAQAFAAIAKGRPDALLLLADLRVFLHNRTRIVDFAVQNHLPGVYPYRELVEAGGLMSFGPNYVNMYRRAAEYVDKILKGAKPADIPVEQPTNFELIINMKTARALGLKIPQSVLVRADRVIE